MRDRFVDQDVEPDAGEAVRVVHVGLAKRNEQVEQRREVRCVMQGIVVLADDLGTGVLHAAVLPVDLDVHVLVERVGGEIQARVLTDDPVGFVHLAGASEGIGIGRERPEDLVAVDRDPVRESHAGARNPLDLP
jgi:hypothetical protein